MRCACEDCNVAECDRNIEQDCLVVEIVALKRLVRMLEEERNYFKAIVTALKDDPDFQKWAKESKQARREEVE